MQCLPLQILAKYFPLTRVIVSFMTLLGVNKVVKTRRGMIKYLSGVLPNGRSRKNDSKMQRIKVVNFDNRF